MSDIGTAAAVLLALVLSWAGITKLRSPARTEGSFTAMGLPAPRALAVGVPCAELVLAIGLVVAPAPAALGAVVLLSAFTGVLGVLLRRPEPVACGCFGSAAAAPVGAADLVRNAGLLAAASAALWAEAVTAPTLPAAIAVTSAAASVLMAMGLVRLRGELGVVWDNTLPGEVQAA